MNVTQRLAEFIVDTEVAPPEAIEQARRAFLDTLGVALAGSREDGPQTVAGWVREQAGREEATVLGQGFRAPASEAALVNGVAAHALDYDDVSTPMRGHPSVPLLPALLALGEKLGAGGRDVLTAYVVGYEMQAKLGRAIGEAHYALGWHATSTFGALGAAAGCARLLRLDAGRAGMALGIAASLADGLQQNFGSMTKPLHAGWAARNGLVASQLAERGFTADRRAIEGPSGFLRAMGGGAEPDLSSFDSLGAPFEVVSSGIGVKLYPCCYALHRALDAVLELRERHEISADQVSRIDVEVSRGGLRPLRKEPPVTGLEGKFSLEYCLAAALVDGRLSLATFTDEAVRRPELLELMAAVSATESDEPSEVPISGYADVRISLVDGSERRFRVDTAGGDPQRPVGWEELVAKFRDCAAGVLPTDSVERTLRLLERFEELPDIAELTGACAGEVRDPSLQAGG